VAPTLENKVSPPLCARVSLIGDTSAMATNRPLDRRR
jgi:hypothetical protein